MFYISDSEIENEHDVTGETPDLSVRPIRLCVCLYLPVITEFTHNGHWGTSSWLIVMVEGRSDHSSWNRV